MPEQKVNIVQIKEMKKAGQKFHMVTAYDYPTAVMVDKSEVELILVGDSLGMTVLGYQSTVPVTMDEMIHHIKAVVRGAPNTFIVGDMPFGSYNESKEQAIRNANRIMKEGGADCIKLEGGQEVAEVVSAIVKAGIPVMGHIGLTPQTVSQLGGYKVQGKDAEGAQKLIDDAKCLEQAGAFSVVIECVPTHISKLITDKTSIPTIGIGAGIECDAQVLVFHDMMGLYDRFTPKFVKQYANLSPIIVEALNSWVKEVRAGDFPEKKHSFTFNAADLEKLY